MRKHLKTYSLIVCILFVAAMLSSGVFSYALNGQFNDDSDLVISDKHSSNDIPSSISIQVLETSIYTGLKNFQSRINISSFKLYPNQIDEINTIFCDLLSKKNDLFYVSNTISYSYGQVTGTVDYIMPNYVISKSELNEATALFNKGIQTALKEVQEENITDLQKVLILHDYVCDSAYYPLVETEYAGVYDEVVPDSDLFHSAYGFFSEGSVVCSGYSLAFCYLMNEAGIPCKYVNSYTMEHSWVKVKIDNNWYNIDLTFDDVDSAAGNNTLGLVHHNFFLKSDSCFEGDSGCYHQDGLVVGSAQADSTIYDDFFWNDIHSRIYAVDSYFYYLKEDLDTNYAFFCKRDLSGEHEEEISDFFVPWAYGCYLDYNASLTYLDFNPEPYYMSFLVASLTRLDGQFYIFSSEYIPLSASSHVVYDKVFCQPIDKNEKKYDVMIADVTDNYDNNDLPEFAGLSHKNGELVLTRYMNGELYETIDREEFFEDNFYGRVNKNLNKVISVKKGDYHPYCDSNNDGYINAKDYGKILKDKNNN